MERAENNWLKKRCEETKAVAKGGLSESDIFLLKEFTEIIRALNEKIRKVEGRIEMLVNERDVAIVSSVPEVGKMSAAAIVAEIGDAGQFVDEGHLASWAGFAPSVYQSAGVFVTGHITKKGSKWLRHVMVEVAHVAVRVRDSRLRAFYLRLRAKKGEKIAVARKMLGIIWPLLVKGERYSEESFEKVVRSVKSAHVGHVPLEEMLRSCGVLVMLCLTVRMADG